MALRDTLEALKQKQNAAADFEAQKPRMIAEWQEAVRVVFSQIEEYLSVFIEEGGLQISKSVKEITEEGLGSYQIPVMFITAGPSRIDVIPVGRSIFGAIGRIDLHRQGRPADERALLLRKQTTKEAAPEWQIRMPPREDLSSLSNWHSSKLALGKLLPFNKENFEAVLDRVLH